MDITDKIIFTNIIVFSLFETIKASFNGKWNIHLPRKDTVESYCYGFKGNNDYFLLQVSSVFQNPACNCLRMLMACTIPFWFGFANLMLLSAKGWVTYRVSYAVCHNDTGGWGRGVITNDALKFKKINEFESSCIVICFSYIYLIINGKSWMVLCFRCNILKLTFSHGKLYTNFGKFNFF